MNWKKICLAVILLIIPFLIAPIKVVVFQIGELIRPSYLIYYCPSFDNYYKVTRIKSAFYIGLSDSMDELNSYRRKCPSNMDYLCMKYHGLDVENGFFIDIHHPDTLYCLSSFNQAKTVMKNIWKEFIGVGKIPNWQEVFYIEGYNYPYHIKDGYAKITLRRRSQDETWNLYYWLDADGPVSLIETERRGFN